MAIHAERGTICSAVYEGHPIPLGGLLSPNITTSREQSTTTGRGEEEVEEEAAPPPDQRRAGDRTVACDDDDEEEEGRIIRPRRGGWRGDGGNMVYEGRVRVLASGWPRRDLALCQ